MNQTYPKTRITRGSLSGPPQLLVAILLLLAASFLLLMAFQQGRPASGAISAIAALLALAASPFIVRWQRHFTGTSALIFCDERALLIRESEARSHVSMLTDVTLLVRDRQGYTLRLENGRLFRLRRKDANPQLLAILDNRHEALEKALKSGTDSTKSQAD